MNGVETVPRVVALVPAWQAAGFIRDTLDSLVAQTWPNLQVLIAVDLCDDDTAAICREYETAHANFRVVVHATRQGWVGNTNWLLANASGDYFLFAFHDDVLAPTYVEALVRALEADPGAIMAYSDVDTDFPDGRIEHTTYTEIEGVSSPTRRARSILKRSGYWWVPNRGVFRSRAAARIGGLKRHAGGEFSADWAWLTHMSLLGGFVRVPRVLCLKHYKRESLSRSWNRSMRNQLHALASCLREVRQSGAALGTRLALHVTAVGVVGRIFRKKIRHAARRLLQALKSRLARVWSQPVN